MSGIVVGVVEVMDWCSAKGREESGRAIDSRALLSASVWFMVSRWRGMMSPFSSEASESRSERGMPSFSLSLSLPPPFAMTTSCNIGGFDKDFCERFWWLL